VKVELTAITPNAEVHCEKAARDCYDSISKMKDTTKSTNLVKNCTIKDHLTINGHSFATFRVQEVSRALMAQLTRQRTACFSIRSQRYVLEDNYKYFTPDSIKNDLKADVIYQLANESLKKWYEQLLECGIPKEDARYILPNACYTTINMSASLEGWIHFLRRRMDNSAQKEIRDLAFEIYKQLNTACPKIINQDTIMAPRKPSIDWERVKPFEYEGASI